MSKAIVVKDSTYDLIKVYAGNSKSTMSGVVKKAIEYFVAVENTRGAMFEGIPELSALYTKTFVEKPVSDKERIKKEILDYVCKCEDTKSKITNFVSSI